MSLRSALYLRPLERGCREGQALALAQRESFQRVIELSRRREEVALVTIEVVVEWHRSKVIAAGNRDEG